MNTKKVIAVACALTSASRLFAGTITFDDAPITGTDLGSFYQGVTFGEGAQVIPQTTPLYPAHSGNQFLSDQDIANPTISATFSTPQSELDFYFTCADGVTITAFDSSHNALGSPLTTSTGNLGTLDHVTITSGLDNIASVEITDNGGLGNFLTIDDFSSRGISGAPAPDVTSTFALLGIAGAGLMAVRRKFAAR